MRLGAASRRTPPGKAKQDRYVRGVRDSPPLAKGDLEGSQQGQE
jgi:hypothetical protein